MNAQKTTFREKTEIKILSSHGSDSASKHVALLMGGMSAERDVSISSGNGVGKALVELGYKVTALDMGADLASVLLEIKPDVVFNCLHGTYGEDGCVPGLLNFLRIPYTHSGVLASALAFDKIKSKDMFRSHDIRVAKDIIIHKKDELKTDPLKRPYVIKPISQGSSVGVEVIFEGDEFDFANYNFPYGDQILVEEYIKGRELQVASIDGKALPAILEIKLLKNRFYDYEAKYTEGFAEHILPANLPEGIKNKALSVTEKISSIFGCRGMIRAEMIYDESKNDLFVLEVNTHPGMTPLSICPEIAAFCGISYNELVRLNVENAKFDE